MSTKEFPWGKVQLLHTADNAVVQVVPNVKERMEAQHSIPPLGLHDLLQERNMCVGKFPVQHLHIRLRNANQGVNFAVHIGGVNKIQVKFG
jgi:hypothetical protein